VNPVSAFPKRVARLVRMHREKSFVVLILAVCFLSFDYQGALGISVGPKPPAPGWPAAGSDARAVLDREYDTVIQEIRARNQVEHMLFALKFSLVGGTLYVLFQQSFPGGLTPLPVLVAWAAVIAAAIVDLRLASNQAFIETLGLWVRQYEAGTLGPGGSALGWEAFLAGHLLDRTLYPALRISGQILTALLFLVAAAIFLLPAARLEEGPTLDAAASTVSRWAGMIGLVIMTMAAISLRRTVDSALPYIAAGVLAGFLVWCLSDRTQDDSPAAQAEAS